MAEGTLSGTVNVPKIGKVKKVYFWGAVGIVGLYVGWKWYSANAGAAGDDITYETSGVAGDDVSASGVVGSGGASGNNPQYAGSTTDGTATDTVDTNGEWTQAATEWLANQGRDPVAVGAALGEFIDRKPLDDSEQAIARAAIAAFGMPPQDRPWTIIPQVAPTTVAAPANLRKWKDATTSRVAIQWDPVPGAMYYRIFKAGNNEAVGASSDTTAYVNAPANTTVSLQVAAMTTLNKQGPKSAAVPFKTASVTLATPRTPTVGSITKTSAKVSTGAVAGATGYNWYINGVAHGHSDAPSYTVVSLKANTSYRVSVAADTANQAPGKQSAAKTFKTKK